MGPIPVSFFGVTLVLLLLVLYAGALTIVWRVPFRALGVLVAGMAFHNFLLMALLDLGTPSLLIRAIQFWKEGVLLLLLARCVPMILNAWRSRYIPRLSLLDLVVIAFAAVTLLYFVLPDAVIQNESNISQRFISLRSTLLLPTLYAFGRLFWSTLREDLIWVTRAILGAAAVVGLFGLWELWFVPTPVWFDWGVNLLSWWLGFTYGGPGGLPENFFQATGSGLVVRRMVSTYISPLGLAYTGLLIVPLGTAMITLNRKEPGLPNWFRWTTFTLLVASIFFSVTRGALLSLVAELVLLLLLLRGRRLFVTTVIVTLGVAFMLFEYVNIGPLLTFNLHEVRPPAGQALAEELGRALSEVFDGNSTSEPTDLESENKRATPDDITKSGELVRRTLTGEDPSTSGHLAALRHGMAYIRQYPFGTGLGSAVFRYGRSEGPGESAILAVFGEMGIIGGVLYVLMYGLGLWSGLRTYWKSRQNRLLAGFPLIPFVGGLALIPISITSAIWGNFSVTFLLWWCIGLSSTLALLPVSQLGSDQAEATIKPGSTVRGLIRSLP